MRDLLEHGACNWIVEKDMDEGHAGLPKGVIMQARGKFAHAGRITSNKRLYTRKWYETQIARVTRKGGELESGAMLGEADHPSPQRGGPSVRQLCFIVRDLSMSEAGEVMGRINVVGTGAGQDYAAGIRAGAQLGFSSRARGDVTSKRMNDQHPDWDLNKDFNGEDFDEVNDDATLTTFDAVLGPAIRDAHVADYNENNNSEEEDMNIKLEEVLKNEELMKGILESEAVKAKIDAALADATKKFESDFESKLAEKVMAYLESDDFAAKFEAKETKDEAELEEVKCPECDGPVGKGAKFCPGCGSKMAVAAKKPDANPDESEAMKDMLKRMEALEKDNAELKSVNDKHDEADKAAVTKESVDEQVDKLLENHGDLIRTRVGARLKDKTLDEDNVEKTVTELIEEESAWIKQTGGEALLEAGKKGGTNDGDLDEDTKDKPKEDTKDVKVLKGLL